MTLEEFADRYKVKVKTDSCGDPIIHGKVRGAQRPEDTHHVFESPKLSNMLAVYFNFETVGRWNNVRKKLLAYGAQLAVAGPYDGYLLFDPLNEPLVKLVLKLARIKVKRQLTEEQKAVIRARFAKK